MQYEEALQILKEQRKMIADREGKALYLVFSNATLEETARLLPQTLDDFRHIKGWGDRKIFQYGNQILHALHHETENTRIATPSHTPDSPLSVYDFLVVVKHTLSLIGIADIVGEISDLKIRERVVYCDLKDATGRDAVVRCLMWRNNFDRYYTHVLTDGALVRVTASPSMYDKDGSFKLLIETVEPIGAGAIKKAFEALKRKLAAKGYFDASRKRPIPPFVRRIGLITSETGDAIRDFLTHLGANGFQIYFADARVEGATAERSIIDAMYDLNRITPTIDVLVLIRGGGGLENLKTFNSEKIADAIIASRVPIITGIGHTRDETIADYVADLSLATPTAVGEFFSSQQNTMRQNMEAYIHALTIHIETIKHQCDRRITIAASSLCHATEHQFHTVRIQLLHCTSRLQEPLRFIFHQFELLTRRLITTSERIEASIQSGKSLLRGQRNLLAERTASHVAQVKQSLAHVSAALQLVNPHGILKRGYSITMRPDGTIIKDARTIPVGTSLRTLLAHGSLHSIVQKK